MEMLKDLGVIYPKETSKHKLHMGIFECPSCKKEITVCLSDVKRGHTKSCKSCANRVKNTKHGEAHTRVYKIYNNIKERCYSIKHPSYDRYGGRGIIMCEEWMRDFNSFKSWALSNGYSDELSIDRINTRGIYEPSNCRWATKTTQSRNTVKLCKSNTTGYRGVIASKNNTFISRITIQNKQHRIGTYKTKQEASNAYDMYVIANNLEHTINNNNLRAEVSFGIF